METATETSSTESTFETFDDMSTEPEDFETFDDLSEDEEESSDKVKDDLKVIKDSQADSEGKVIKDDKEKKESKKEEDKDEEVDEEDSEEEDSEEEAKEDKPEEEKEEDKKPKSKLRLKMGNEQYNIDSNATLKVKVDGKTEEVPVQELINNYSGKTAWDKKFTELGKEKKDLEFYKYQVETEKNKMMDHVNRAIKPLLDPDANPMESLMYLVEFSGQDPYNAYRRIMEANLTELSSLIDMTETERELYFHKKKDELHGKIYQQRTERQKEEDSLTRTRQAVDQLRQAKNVSEVQFIEASDELEELYKGAGLDVNELTPEDVVDYASLRPHIPVVRELIAPYQDNIADEKYGDIVSELSKYLRDGKATKKEIESLLKRNFSVEEEVKDLNTKVYAKQKGKPAKKQIDQVSSDKFESFDDF